MPDVLIDGVSTPGWEKLQPASTFETSPGIFYQFYLTDAFTLVYSKSVDGALTWSAPVTIATDALETLIKAVFCYDRKTEGLTGTLIHIFYISRDPGAGATSTREYRNLDVSDDSLSAPLSVGTGGVNPTANWVASCITITKTRAGNLYIGAIVDGGATDNWLIRSTDDGLTWTAAGTLTSPMDGTAIDKILFLPGNLADADDFWCVYLDRIPTPELTVKTYTAFTDSWSESAAAVNAVTLYDGAYFQFHASIRHSDGHMIIPIWSQTNNPAADLRVFEWDGTTITALTPISINVDEAGVTTILIDQETDDLYVSRLFGASWEVTVGVDAFRSQDGGSSWAALPGYSADPDDDLRWISCDISPPAGGTFLLVWRNQDLGDVLTNTDNAIALPAAGPAGGSTGQQQRGLLL